MSDIAPYRIVILDSWERYFTIINWERARRKQQPVSPQQAQRLVRTLKQPKIDWETYLRYELDTLPVRPTDDRKD